MKIWLEQLRNAVSKLGLFGRTFILLVTLMLACLGSWVQVFIVLEREPRATQISKRVATSVNLTRSALTYAGGNDIPSLLTDLSRNEGIDVLPRTDKDVIGELPDDSYWELVASLLQHYLGAQTVMAWTVNNRPGFWIGVNISDEKYWLVFDREELSLTDGMDWLSWAVAAIILSLIGALISVRYINRPHARLARYAQMISRGETPPPLPDQGAREIRALNASFNRMAHELHQTDSDRELMIAGISHDLRTPLTRMRLEIELSSIPETALRAIDQDLQEIDQSIDQLLEYARASRPHAQPCINVSTALDTTIAREHLHTDLTLHHLSTVIEPDLYADIDPLSLRRIVLNLIGNAYRYGGNETGSSDITVKLYAKERETVVLEVSDRGGGVAPEDIAKLTRPFYRGNTARSGGAGTGLGLAIVERLLRQAGGSLELVQRTGGGLTARVHLPRRTSSHSA